MPGGLCAERPGRRVGCEDCLGSTLFSITKPQPSAIAQAHDKDKAQGGRTPRIPDPGLPGSWAPDLRWQRDWEKQGTISTYLSSQYPQDLASKAARPVEGVPTCAGPRAGRGQVPCYAGPGEATCNSASGRLAPGME